MATFNMGNPSGVGQALTQPVAPVAGAPQQADPNLIQRFLMSLKANPNLQRSLLTTGLSLLGDPQQGESGFGTFSRSALTGVNQFNALNEADRQRGIQDKQLALQERGVASLEGARESAAETAEARTKLARDQFASNLSMASAKLQNNLDVANIRANAQTSAAGAGSTGAERLQSSMAQFFIDAGMYDNTTEGKALANLRAAGLTGEVTPDTRLRVIGTMMDQLAQDNVFREEDKRLTAEQIQELATQAVDSVVGANPQGPDAETIPELEQIKIQGQVMQVQPQPDGSFKLVNGQGVLSDQSFTNEQIEQLRRASAGFETVNP